MIRKSIGSILIRNRHYQKVANSGRCTYATSRDLYNLSKNPIARANDVEDDVWHSIYDVAHHMMGASYLSYPLSFLLREVKENGANITDSNEFLKKLENIQDGDLSTALYPSDIIGLIQSNRKYFEDHYTSMFAGKTNFEDSFGWFQVLHRFQQMVGEDPTNMQLLEFDDHHDRYRLAYGIGINKRLKRITFTFRGTYADGTSDWKRNLQITQLEVPLPEALFDGIDGTNNNSNSKVTTKPSTTPHVYFHRGCYEYLFKNKDRDPFTHPKEAYEEILDNMLTIIQQYPDYKIYISGHSLGGALALLVAFYASADNRIPKPVTCVSCGSLLVGDRQFQSAFRKLESKGWIQHLRITNDDDPVPYLPPFSWYRPVGVHLCLKQNDGYTISQKHNATSMSTKSEQRIMLAKGDEGAESSRSAWHFLLKAFKNFKSLDRLLQPHDVSEYLRRLERERDTLKEITLDDCYRNPNVVGR